jgi:polysaccharide biosynthesis protein PslG
MALLVVLAGSLLLLGQGSAMTVRASVGLATLPGPEIPDGLGLNVNYQALRQAPASVIDLLCAAGFHTLRTDLNWQTVERTAGVYDFAGSGYDAFVQDLHQRGERTILILDYSNSLYDQNLSPYDAPGRQAFARFAAAAVRHYRGMGVVWELYNEPDNHGFWRPAPDARTYAALVNTAVPAMRAADPEALIIGPALHENNPSARSFLIPLAEAGALNQFDAISVHPYRLLTPESMIADYAALQRLLARYGVRAPIVASEVGYSLASDVGTTWGSGTAASVITPDRASPDTHRGLTASEQAAALVRTYLAGLSEGVNLTVWYDWRDDCADPAVISRQCHFGVLDRRFQPKPPLLAAQTLSAVLSGYRFVARLPVSSAHEMVLSFSHGNGAAYVLWTDRPGQWVTVRLPLWGRWMLLDLFGAQDRVFSAHGSSAIVVTGMPEYLLPLSEFYLDSKHARFYIQLSG